MTRTFCVGEPTAELVEWQRLVKEALDNSIAAIRPGVDGRAVFDAACEVFEAAGYATQRTKEPGSVLDHGFFHGLGHGVGLQVHEAPGMGLAGHDVLQAGDVVTVEPGLYRPGTGGCRLEDLVLVTEDGVENLTRFPYDLAP
jgi:Xaa-Pro aminopeptidase